MDEVKGYTEVTSSAESRANIRSLLLSLRRVLVHLRSLVFPFPLALFVYISPLSISFPGNSRSLKRPARINQLVNYPGTEPSRA